MCRWNVYSVFSKRLKYCTLTFLTIALWLLSSDRVIIFEKDQVKNLTYEFAQLSCIMTKPCSMCRSADLRWELADIYMGRCYWQSLLGHMELVTHVNSGPGHTSFWDGGNDHNFFFGKCGIGHNFVMNSTQPFCRGGNDHNQKKWGWN